MRWNKLTGDMPESHKGGRAALSHVTTSVNPPPLARDVGLSGTMLGTARLDALLGAGTSSEVYRATSPLFDRPCTVKVFRKELGIGPVIRGRYTHFCRQINRLNDPDIADVFSHGVTPDGRTYSVGELVNGLPLQALIQRHGSLPRKSCLGILRRLCSCLGMAHAHGLVHLRLHPGNIMVDWQDGEITSVRLLDFGVALLHPADAESRKALPLKPQHALCLAPEQARGDAGDTRTDVYALCALLYQLTSGRAPFEGNSYAETLERILSEPVTPPSASISVDRDIEEAILHGLEKDPRQRTPSAEALMSAIDPVSVSTGHHQLLARSHLPKQRTLSTGEHRLYETASEGNNAFRTAWYRYSSMIDPRWRRPLLFGALGLILAVFLSFAFCGCATASQLPSARCTSDVSRSARTIARRASARRCWPAPTQQLRDRTRRLALTADVGHEIRGITPDANSWG